MVDTIKKSIPLASPDFDDIKTNLKNFLKMQDELKDYDFEDSVISVLLDILSANSHLNAFYLNQIGNESFLQTAVRRDSVVSRASALGFLPRSAICSTATIFIEMLSSTNPELIVIPQGTIFSAQTNNQTFYFRTVDEYRVLRDSNGRYLSTIDIVEGKALTHRFPITQLVLDNGLVIPNTNVDVTRLDIVVKEDSASSSFNRYNRMDDILAVRAEDRVFYINEEDSGLYRIRFGDGVLGFQPAVGGEVRVSYMISSGPVANGIGAFTLTSPITSVDSALIQVVSASNGGNLPESIESIKFRAPRIYEVQNRAVTESDYEEIIREKYQAIRDVIAWGGEKNIPKQFGKVFISIVPTAGYFITQSEKIRIQELIKKYNVTTVTPVVVDVDYIFLEVTTLVDYDGNETDLTDGQIQDAVVSSIMKYNTDYLGKFSRDLRYSVLSRYIDNADKSILSSRTSLRLSKNIFALVGRSQDISSSFNNALIPGTLISSTFTYNGYAGSYFEDAGNGKLNIFTNDSTGKVLITMNAASIDYETGEMDINGFEITSIDSKYVDELTGQPFIKFFVEPQVLDVDVTNRQILTVETVRVAPTKVLNNRV